MVGIAALKAPTPAVASTGKSAMRSRRVAVSCRAQNQDLSFDSIKRRAAAAAAAALIVATPLCALANEFDLLANGTPDSYILDDASALNKTTKKSVGDALQELERETGYRVEVATVRKLEFENDAFVFGDKLVSKWFPGATDKRGLLLVVTAGKDGALTGGDSFMKAIGDDLIDSVIGENVSILTEEEKYNEAVQSSVNRVVAKLTNKEDPGPPIRVERQRKRTYKTKGETARTKTATSTIVLTLLGISVVVPMLQYYGYTNKD
ncbi:putative UPF0603 protein [Nannochloris sp. 'desiccata']|nr:putative UPF0603 protein [Chlorella desiccata (nom. nud.)]